MSQVKRCILTKEQREKWINTNWRYTTLVFKWTDNYLGGACRVYDKRGDLMKGLSASGCGYDKKGTVLGHFIKEHFAEELKKLDSSKFYGMGFYNSKRKDRNQKRWSKDCSIWIDGACGWNSMESILNKIGFKIPYVAETKATTTHILRAV